MKKHEIFKTNPNLKEVHMTSDGQAFYNDNDAKLHAKSLEDKKVELVLNPDHIEVVAEEVLETKEQVPTAGTEVQPASTEVEETKVAEISKTDLSRLSKESLIAFAKENALELDETLTNKKMVVAIMALLEAKK